MTGEGGGVGSNTVAGNGRRTGSLSSGSRTSNTTITTPSTHSTASTASAVSTRRRVSVNGSRPPPAPGSAGARSASQYGTKSGPCGSPSSVPPTSTGSRNRSAPGPFGRYGVATHGARPRSAASTRGTPPAPPASAPRPRHNSPRRPDACLTAETNRSRAAPSSAAPLVSNAIDTARPSAACPRYTNPAGAACKRACTTKGPTRGGSPYCNGAVTLTVTASIFPDTRLRARFRKSWGRLVNMASMSVAEDLPSGTDAAALREALQEVRKVIVGQDHMVERLLVALLARGHCLLEGVPGVAKTLAASTLATVVGGTFARIQFTPDLVPSDIVGTRVYHPSSEQFDVELGPVFVNFLLADEINRAPAKVQSALLEVMAERQVTLAGVTHPLPKPFIVLATQNPIESEGVYPLPEVQRDRFLFRVRVHHPSAHEEMEILQRMSVTPPTPRQILDPDRLLALQQQAEQVSVHQLVADYVVRLVMATRSPADYGLAPLDDTIEIGVSPRATLGLVAAGRALALLRGRDYLLPDDVRDVAVDVMAHRLMLTFDAIADGVDPEQVIRQILHAVPPPLVVWNNQR